MKQSILFNRQPLLINVQLAEKIGLNEAIFFQQIHYWLQKSTIQSDGVGYVYNTAQDWVKQFPFWSESTIRRIVSVLSERGLIVIKKLSDNKHDRTNYYTINYSHPDLYENGQDDCDMIHPVKLTESKHPKRHDLHPENTTENTTENTKRTRKQKDAFMLPDGLNQFAWDRWIEYRKQARLKAYTNTPMSAGVQAKKLIEISGGDLNIQMMIVNQSIESSWSGLFPLKQPGFNGGRKLSNIEAAQMAAQAMGVVYDPDEPF